MHSRVPAFTIALGVGAALAIACHSAPPPPPPPPPPLSDSAAAALTWVESNATPFQPGDSVASPRERAALTDLAEGARVIGFSELTEGTHEFPAIIRRALFALAESSHVRGLAIQAPMAEATEVDRYVRTGAGNVDDLLASLGSWRWETREMHALVEAMRAWNRGRAATEQIGFYGFEIPSARHAVSVVISLPDSVIGASLKAWAEQQYSCVAINESAHFGREGRAADSAYWNACAPRTTAVVDSIVALRRRIGPTSPAAAKVAFAEQMARLVEHHVHTGLRHLARQNANAEHVLYLADALGPDAKLMLWGGDAEMGRMTLDTTIVQTGVPLGERLAGRYRPIAFAFGGGVVRTRAAENRGQSSDLSNVRVSRPLPDTYEDVLSRVPRDGFWLDMRSPPPGRGGAWLHGPRPMRLITELYSSRAPELFQVPVALPANFDAVVFVRETTAARQ